MYVLYINLYLCIQSQNDDIAFSGGKVQLFHCCAFKLISLLPPGLENIIDGLLSTVLFYSCFYQLVYVLSLH